MIWPRDLPYPDALDAADFLIVRLTFSLVAPALNEFIKDDTVVGYRSAKLFSARSSPVEADCDGVRRAAIFHYAR